MIYKGLIFDDTLPEGKIKADIEIRQGMSLKATYNRKSITLDLSTTEFKIGGIDNDMLYFYPPAGSSNPVVLVHDATIIQELANSPDQDIQARIEKISISMKKKKRRKIAGIASIVIFLGLIVSLVIGGSMTSFVVNFIPVQWDEKLGDLGYASAVSAIAPGATKIDDAVVIQAVEKISKRLTDSLKSSRFHYHITVFKAPVENAFALPGGKIVIFSGLLLKSNNADEIAGILAHEIMHVEKRHAIKQIIRTVGLTALLQIFLGDSQGAIAAVMQAGGELLTLGYGRSMESEADREGMRLLAKSGISAKGLIDFFKKLSESEKELKAIEWLSTHPMSEKRAEQLEVLSKKYKPEKLISLSINWKQVKSRLK